MPPSTTDADSHKRGGSDGDDPGVADFGERLNDKLLLRGAAGALHMCKACACAAMRRCCCARHGGR